ncbi:MAG: HEAT repeat domain-containing protein [Planctomycetota bacterium]|jgi:HEAT repeat protein
MRLPRPLVLLILAACGPPTYDGRTAHEWMDELEEGSEAELARLEEIEAVPILMEIVRSKRVKARLMAIQVLAQLGPDAKEAVPALIEALDAQEPAVRAFAALALGRIGKPAADAVVRLEQALRDPHARVRVASALAAWGITGDLETARAVLWQALTSNDPRVRTMAAEAFGELGEAGIDLMILALADLDEQVRAAAAETLGRIGAGSKAARTALEEATKDTSPLVVAAAKQGLAALGPGPERAPPEGR